MAGNKYILMLEGDMDDQFITEDSLKQTGRPTSFYFIENSKQLLPYLDECIDKGRALPGVIILSILSAPDDGLSILKQIKAHEAYHMIPVVILCEHAPAHIVNECYSEGANSVIQKPASNELTIKKIESFINYWFETVELPLPNRINHAVKLTDMP